MMPLHLPSTEALEEEAALPRRTPLASLACRTVAAFVANFFLNSRRSVLFLQGLVLGFADDEPILAAQDVAGHVEADDFVHATWVVNLLEPLADDFQDGVAVLLREDALRQCPQGGEHILPTHVEAPVRNLPRRSSASSTRRSARPMPMGRKAHASRQASGARGRSSASGGSTSATNMGFSPRTCSATKIGFSPRTCRPRCPRPSA